MPATSPSSHDPIRLRLRRADPGDEDREDRQVEGTVLPQEEGSKSLLQSGAEGGSAGGAAETIRRSCGEGREVK
eukprot:374397-Hanusia_phi.AAC.1